MTLSLSGISFLSLSFIAVMGVGMIGHVVEKVLNCVLKTVFR